VFGSVGNAGNSGYGGGQNGQNLAAISDQYLFDDGDVNLGIQDHPGYHELALHPAGNVAGGSFDGQSAQPYVDARWTAGASSTGSANIVGSVRNFITAGDSVDFHIFVNGVEKFSASGSGGTLPESPFDFDVQLHLGSVVDFVLGNGPANNLFGDESLLRAMIFTAYDEFLPVEGDLNGDGLITAADWVLERSYFHGNLSAASRQEAYRHGDLNGDLRNDELDFALFKKAYEAAHGAGSFAAMASVPEPASFILLAACFMPAAFFSRVGWVRRAAATHQTNGRTYFVHDEFSLRETPIPLRGDLRIHFA
jgi:hypothetical protein